MSYKEWNAVVMLLAGIGALAWLALELGGLTATPADLAAWRLLWAILWLVAVNIVAIIVVLILVSIARGEELRDERADERDRLVNARSMRNAYFAASIGGLGVLVLLALGATPALAACALFAVLNLAGIIDAASRLAYYRIG